MLYSLNYHTQYKQQADELRVPWNQIGQIQEFIEQGKRCVVNDVNTDNIDQAITELSKLREKYSENYTVACGDLSTLQTLLYDGYNAFLRFPISDWESYQSLVSAGVSDIYIDGPLAFSGSRLALSKQDVKLRTSPQISPNASLLPLVVTANTFFIRPEDMKFYEGIFDIVDFKEKNQEKEDTLFKIYKRGSWAGDLKDLIETVQESVPNAFIKPEFGESRVNCDQICKVPKHSCHLCSTQLQLTNLVVDYFSEKNEQN